MRNWIISIAVVLFLLYTCQQADSKAAGKKGKRIKKPTPLLIDHLGRQIPEVDQMVEWIKSNGGLLAPAYLWSEVKDAGSKLAPYLRTLPARSQVWSYYTIPESYLPLIQNDAVVSHLRGEKAGTAVTMND
eukprot:gene10708-10865_t